ncbi:hypothetical protein JZ751_019643 [Albula glossodonta]|uniref:Uncharacterized protein n=1 Tax=Albula glossodonta TaxID=121402 RepID=A0A8T2NMF8_9TELE|nr:hypothetical protein JZ751_019643 [Albula glossodonta]
MCARASGQKRTVWIHNNTPPLPTHSPFGITVPTAESGCRRRPLAWRQAPVERLRAVQQVPIKSNSYPIRINILSHIKNH